MNLRRRPFIAAGGIALFALSWIARSQPTGRVWRIGVLQQDGPQEWQARLVRALRALGYEEARNIAFDYKLALGAPGRLDALAAELVAARVDLIVTALTPEALAAKRATGTIPIVMQYATEPVELGLVASLARPGGNVTGTTTNSPALAGKMIQVLRDALPGLRQLTALADPSYPGMRWYLGYAERACAALGIQMTTLPVGTTRDLDAAFAAMERVRPGAVFVATTGEILGSVSRVVDFAARQRLPAMYAVNFPVYDGGLMSYAANFEAMAKRNAWMIDRIFKGSRPADIPVEEPALFSFVVNLRTARAMGLTIPSAVLLRADEVIQ